MALTRTNWVTLGAAVIGAVAIMAAALWKSSPTQITQSGSNNSQTTVIGSGNLLMFGAAPADPELKRRAELLGKLRNLYISSHDGITSQMMAGLEDPPADWTNAELEKRGENWRVTSRNKLPPFITVNDVKIEPSRGPDGVVTHWQLKPVIQNTGTTPTHDMKYIIGIGIARFEPGQKRPSLFEIGPGDIAENVAMSSATLGPKETLLLQRGPGIPIDDIKKIQRGEEIVLVSGVVKYSEWSNGENRHETKFCFIATKDSNSPDAEPPYAIMCGRGNCADDECKAQTGK